MTTGSAVHYRFHHRHLIVADVAKTVAFYEGTLGAKKVQEMEFRGIPIVRLELDGMPLTISRQIHAGVGDHIGLAVDDFEAAVTELRAKGAHFIVEPTDMGVAKFCLYSGRGGHNAGGPPGDEAKLTHEEGRAGNTSTILAKREGERFSRVSMQRKGIH